jgi:hypothetical protein
MLGSEANRGYPEYERPISEKTTLIPRLVSEGIYHRSERSKSMPMIVTRYRVIRTFRDADKGNESRLGQFVGGQQHEMGSKSSRCRQTQVATAAWNIPLLSDPR